LKLFLAGGAQWRPIAPSGAVGPCQEITPPTTRGGG
jgi:hypothetical protein